MNIALITARQGRGLSQKELANEMNVSVTSVSRWEQGISHPHLFHRRKLALFFGKSEQEMGFHQTSCNDEFLLLQCDVLMHMARVARELGDLARANQYVAEAWTLLHSEIHTKEEGLVSLRS